MKLYVTRHGETIMNAQHKVSGLGDVPLTERGRAQAQQLALLAEEKEIHRIIASPLQRAQDTAKAVAERKGLPIETEPKLRELDYGRFDQVPIDDPEFLKVKRCITCHMGGGESVLKAAARIYPFLDQLHENAHGENILLVCHGTVCRIIHSYFHDMTEEEFWASIPDNCQLREYEW